MDLKNAIVVMFDSLSYRYIGCYGNTWIKTPIFDRFAAEGVLFENCYTEGLPTVPCRRAMHTGRYTLQAKGWSALDMDDTTIADLCWGRPIDTALIFDCPMYRLPKFGYSRGFDKVYFVRGHGGDYGFYDNDPLLHYKPEDYHEQHVIDHADEIMGEKVMAHTLHATAAYLRFRQQWRGPQDRYVARTIRKAVDYLNQVDRNKQFFLWVDSFDPHEPWDAASVWDADKKCPYDPDYTGKDQWSPVMGPASIYTEPELHHIRMLYAELVTQCDAELGKFLDVVRDLGLEQSTLVMLVSDHGEPLGNAEHGHGIMCKVRPWPYDELAHTPMFLRAPGVAPGQRIKAYVQSCDVAPTVCDWLGIGVHPDMTGKSLLPLVRGEVDKVRDFAIAGYYKYSWALYNDDWSYIHWPRPEEKTYSGSMYGIAGEGMAKSSAYLVKAGRGSLMDFAGDIAAEAGDTVKEQAEKKAEQPEGWDNNALDGEDQWTCGHNSKAEVPERDELYDRRTDPYQLHNMADKYPDVALKMLTTLKDFMAELRAR